MIKEIKITSSDDIREFCIRNNMYTCGNNDDYTKLLNYVNDNHLNITIEVLHNIASDIYWHSKGYNSDFANDEILYLMGLINREAVCTMYINEDNYEGEVCNDR